MTKREEWFELASRCEKATGPDREIDLAIWVALGCSVERRERDRKEWLYPGKESWSRQDPSFLGVMYRVTASLDAITALIERELPGRTWASWRIDGGAKASIDPITPQALYADAATEPLARCAAFCRAKAEVSHDQA